MAGEGQKAPLQCIPHARGFIATGAVATGVAGLAAGLAGALPLQVPPLLVLPIFLLGLAAYCYELSGRHTWIVARSFLTGDRFEACAQAMRDAAPLLDLEVPGSAAVPYGVVQWRDETLWLGLGIDKHGGLVLAHFPLEFIPGDHTEALALDSAGSDLAEQAVAGGCRSPREADRALATSSAEIHLRLRWPGGEETGEPVPRLLICGPAGVDFPCPGLVLLACLCFLGVLLDTILVGLAVPVEWPIRKRFFTREGGRLGALSFSCSSEGVVEMDGDVKELRTANRFWIRDDKHWRAVEQEVAGLGPALICLRWLRRVGQGLAVLVGVLAAGRIFWAPAGPHLVEGPWLLLWCAIAAAGLWGLGPLADWLAQRRVLAASEKLGSLLPGGATVTAAWVGGEDAAKGELSIEVEQPKPSIGMPEDVPVFRTSSMLTKSTSSTLYYPGMIQCGKVAQPCVHRSQTV
mmetsp:Transcript_100156/g.318071  ORF Transcript_100156/g.318071 Transcript_100156/m.318071 type:complete len:462 (-) Transcript_100156:190-1575(-)